VIVVDSIKPEIYCFVDTVIWLDALGDFTINTNFIDSSTTEACGIQSAVIDITDFSCSDIGNNTVTYTVTDNNGNISNCQTNVIVVDTIKPSAFCFADTTIYLDNDSA